LELWLPFRGMRPVYPNHNSKIGEGFLLLFFFALLAAAPVARR
jgi:hypothetical protein